MPDREKVLKGLEHCIARYIDGLCDDCPYMGELDKSYMVPMKCKEIIMRDALELLKEQEVEHRRLLSWLGKFCRHIDNGDTWLTDEENTAFFKEKMKQQFGWDTD